MIKPHHKKITIIGCAGSGKTTVALQLKEKLKLPLYHLDQYYWKPGWQRVGLEAFTEIHDALCKQDQWIIEGSYIKLLPQRARHADVIIFLDVPRYKCLWYVLKRSALNLGKVLPGSSQGCRQRLLSIEFVKFLKWVWDFNKRYRKTILDIMNQFQNTKTVHTLKSPQEINKLVG
jgi:adenylate kinase family enzyme